LNVDLFVEETAPRRTASHCRVAPRRVVPRGANWSTAAKFGFCLGVFAVAPLEF